MTSFEKSEYPAYQGGQNAALWLTAALWGIALGALAVLRVTWQGAEWFAIATVSMVVFVTIGWCQASLSNGFHEAVHKNFGANHKDWLSLALLGYPTFFTLQYRTVHLQHHLKAGDPAEDPDFATYGAFPRTRVELITRLVMMGSGLAAAKQLLTKNLRSGEKVTGRERTSARSKLGPDLIGLAAVQLVIVSFFLALFGPWPGPLFYVGFWVLPLGMVAKLAKSTRAFCEHGSPDRAFVLRTITGKPWQTATLGMYGFHFHAEHHLFPWVPYARLSALHARLKPELLDQPDTREGYYEHFHGGYFGLLAKWFRELPWSRPSSADAAVEKAR